jgi:glycosyltransferase involved in cell wall biosynthesis
MGFPNLDQYTQKAESLGISGFVTFTGRIPYENAPVYLALGDFAVAPKLSLTEGAGKLLNYMAVGLPVVAFDTPVAREYLGSDGALAERGDVASLAAKLLAYVDLAHTAPEQLGVMGRRLRQRAIQTFSWDKAGNMIAQVYRELLGAATPVVAPGESRPAAPR